MKIFKSSESSFEATLAQLIAPARAHYQNVETIVTEIIQNIIRDKNKALLKYTNDLDRVSLRPEDLMLSTDEINRYCSEVPEENKTALNVAAERIKRFHIKQLPTNDYWTDETGIEMGWRWQPIERIGIYVPGGLASYPSSVLMNSIPAAIAGAKEIVMVSPTPSGNLSPMVIYAAAIAGVDKIYRVGGAQAIAALTFGTETILPVDKIVGPGNSYVAEAKRQVFGRVGIDMIAGPSEVVIIADEKNNPSWISADLLSQAEHDVNAQSILITTSLELAEAVQKSLKDQIGELNRKTIASESCQKNGAIIVTKSLEHAVNLSNRFAPEHLQLCVEDPELILNEIKNAGSIFLGAWTPEVLGDYVIGTNHVLPTERSARFASGLSVLDFMKRTFISKVSPSSIEAVAKPASILAREEGLGAHKLSVDLRINQLKTACDEKK